MHRLLYRYRQSRLLPLLVGLCYLVINLVLPLQHNHASEETQPPVQNASVSVSRHVSLPQHVQLSAAQKFSHHAPCFACEWQSAAVSAALPSFVFSFSMPVATRVITTLPRYLSLRIISTSSRAPPIVSSSL